jgi:hypothetical protein
VTVTEKDQEVGWWGRAVITRSDDFIIHDTFFCQDHCFSILTRVIMFETIVANVLNKFLGDFVDNLEYNQLNIGIWSGKVNGI